MTGVARRVRRRLVRPGFDRVALIARLEHGARPALAACARGTGLRAEQRLHQSLGQRTLAQPLRPRDQQAVWQASLRHGLARLLPGAFEPGLRSLAHGSESIQASSAAQADAATSACAREASMTRQRAGSCAARTR
jgi:hypothetical protein